MTAERVYKLPGGGRIRVRVTTDAADEKHFPVLAEDVAVKAGEKLLDIANLVKAQ